MAGLLVAFVAVPALAQPGAPSTDWPTYNGNARRSAVYAAPFEARGLSEAWVYSPPVPAHPAWPGPDARDYYNSPTVDNEDRLDLDAVFHLAAAGDAVYFGSSGEDSLRCLSLEDGRPRWAFPTDGPVRFAPHVVGDRVYFGSDDGCIYCVRAADGELVWRYRAAPSEYQVPSDGRIVSLWPNRSGVAVVDGIVYGAAGVFPSEGVFVFALDADTGSDTGPGLYRLRFTDMSLQGYVLASRDHVFFPGGRAGPWVFDRLTGSRRGQLGGGGGTYALLTPEDSLVYGPGKTSAVLEEFRASAGDRLAAYPGAKHLVVTPVRAFAATYDSLFALDHPRYVAASRRIAELSERRSELAEGSPERAAADEAVAAATRDQDESVVWRRAEALPHSLVAAGPYVIAGGVGRVAAFSAEDGELVWSAAVDGLAKGLAVARGRLLVSTDRSKVYCFR